MKLISWNVNGIRAAERNGFLNWFDQQNADIVCVQEIKASPDQITIDMLHPLKYNSFWFPAQKPGYSGTAIYSRKEPLAIKEGIGLPQFDSEGRILVAEYPNFTLLNAYFPNSQREHTRLGYKLEFCQAIYEYCETLRKQGKSVILCGDFNIAHREIDLKNPKANEKNAGFLPEERAWMQSFLNHGYIDTFRNFTPEGGHYTWWSYRPGVREKNIGWRLDYFCVDPSLRDRLKSVVHQPEVRGSDHCPVVLELRE